MRDPYAPLRMPAPVHTPSVRVEAKRHLVLSLWLSAMMAVATVTVVMARPAAAEFTGTSVTHLVPR